MQNNILTLEKLAIDAALSGNWQDAVTFNLQILEVNPEIQDAKVRLGRAYLQSGDFSKAKKLFKDVLEKDPINAVAQKNYKLASEKKVERGFHNSVDAGSLIKEPGTTQEVKLEITARKMFADTFVPGEALLIKVDKNSANFYKVRKNEEVLVSSLSSDLVAKLQYAKSHGADLTAYFVSGNDKVANVMVRSSVPVFKSEKQEVRPYIKKGSIDEPELEIPELEE